MEKKKTSRADLENKKNTFFLVGLVVALGGTLLAFEWTTQPGKAQSLGIAQSQAIEDEFIPITREQEIKPPPPPPLPQVIEVLNIVDNKVDIDEELIIEDSGADDGTIIDIQPVVTTMKEEVEEKEEIFFNIIEEPAEFPGGDRALYKYLMDHVNYPVIAQENGIQGKVYVKFVVDEKGAVGSSEIMRGVDASLDKEALRVVNSLPKFKPGKQRGKAVKVYYTAIINYQLQ